MNWKNTSVHRRWPALRLAGAAHAAIARRKIRARRPTPRRMKGKRVVLVPMAMGFDLAQGWAAYLKREVEGWGGVFETRDPNWSIEAGARPSPR